MKIKIGILVVILALLPLSVCAFSDVRQQTPWAEQSINHLRELGIVNGVSDTAFDPNGNVTREQFAKMIVLALGDAEYTTGTSFLDVDAAEWYAPYVYTAKSAGIVNGVSETAFGVEQNITREQMAAMIYRAGTLMGFAPEGERVFFLDEAQMSDYAKPAIYALAQGGVTDACADGNFRPQDAATRAEAAYMIDCLLQAVHHTPIQRMGWQALNGCDPLVSLQQNFNGLTPKEYPNRDLSSFYGWYFVPDSSSTLAVVNTPAGKEENQSETDYAIELKANNSNKAAYFDTAPFIMSPKTQGVLRLEMNVYPSCETKDKGYKAFEARFMTESDGKRQILHLFYLSGDGSIYYYDQSLRSVRCGDYIENQWMHIAVDMDTVNRVYTLYINGNQAANAVPFNDAGIVWDGTNTVSAYQKIRLRLGVLPNQAGTSSVIFDDVLFACRAEAPAILLQKATANSLTVAMPENMEEASLRELAVTKDGETVPYTGKWSQGMYTMQFATPLQAGEYNLQVGRFVRTQDGLNVGESYAIPFTVKEAQHD